MAGNGIPGYSFLTKKQKVQIIFNSGLDNWGKI